MVDKNITGRNLKEETLDTIVTGRVYKRYKNFIDENKINVGKLIMVTLDKMDEGLKK